MRIARTALAAALLVAATLPSAAPGARRGGSQGGDRRWASARAIASYVEAHRRVRAGDGRGAVDALSLAVAHDPGSPELRVSLGGALLAVDRLDAAEVEARRALELAGEAGPAASEAHVLLARVAAARGLLEPAVLALRRAVRVEASLARSGGRADATPWRLLAELYLEEGDDTAAARVLEELGPLDPAEAAAGLRDVASALLDRGQAGPAERTLRRALALAPAELETLRMLAATHDALGRPEEARDDHLAILRREPDDAEALAALGRLAAQAGDVERGRDWFHRYARAAPERAEALRETAFEWLDAGRPTEALAAAREGLSEPGADPRLRLAEGLALRELRRYGEAAAALAAVPEEDPFWLVARAALADALSRAGRHGEAERSLAAPSRRAPEDARLLVVRAEVLARAGRRAEGIALLRAAARDKGRSGTHGELAEVAAALADALVRAGEPEEAVAALRAALASAPRNEALLYALGATYHRAGQPEAAVAQMRALLALAPDHAEALNFVGYALAERGTRLEEAERLLRRATELRPRSGHVLDSLGWVLYRRGDYARAAEVLERAATLAGPDAVILEHLGDAYRALARTDDAALAYRRALGADHDGSDDAEDRRRRRAGIERKLRELGATARSRAAP